MKLISWNVNGLRAVHKKGNFADVFEHDPDILCLQETKASPEQLGDELLNVAGCHSYFASSVAKKGYSGVAIYTKEEPGNVDRGMGIKKFDDEGRIITAHYKDFVLLCVYFPNGGRGLERVKYKLEFYDAFLEYVESLREKQKNIIFCGDVNTAHEEIDLARPKENEKHSGFMPEERAWVDEVINHGYIDTFRYFYPARVESYSYWDQLTRARDRNIGWRIDYFFVSSELEGKLKGAGILTNVFGSDHAPVTLELAEF